jgi:hypothetical protein
LAVDRVATGYAELWGELGGSMRRHAPASRVSAPPPARPAVRPFTNLDLMALPPETGTSRVQADGLGVAIGAGSRAENGAETKRFAGEARRLRGQVVQQQSEVELLQTELERLARELRRGTEDRAARSLEAAERRTRGALERAEAALRLRRGELAELEERARRAGLLPGDLRD